MSARRAPVATSKAGMLTKPIVDRRRKWYPVTLLAQQGLRTVEEIVGWIEAGKLRGFNGSNGWVVHRDQLPVWSELCKTEPSANRYTSIAKLLADHPDLRAVHEAMNKAVWATPYDPKKHDRAKADWQRALADRQITLEFGRSDIGFGAGFSVPDADEPGFQPIDHNRYGDAAEEQEANA